jgi:hypothetical protein
MLCARLAIDRESPLVGSLTTLRQLRGDPPTTTVHAYYVGSMPSKTEAAARRLVDELSRATGGRLKQMRSLQQMVDHAGADPEAVDHAVKRDWVQISPANDPHSIELTEAGRSLAE